MSFRILVFFATLIDMSDLAAGQVRTLAECAAKCFENGQCCAGLYTECHRPSCYQGCLIAAWSTKTAGELQCNTTCAAAQKAGCSYAPPGANFTIGMCSVDGERDVNNAPPSPSAAPPTPPYTPWPYEGCPRKHFDPTSRTFVMNTPPGNVPFWPPGYQYGGCGSCSDWQHQCGVGCVIAYNQAYDPGPSNNPGLPGSDPAPPIPPPLPRYTPPPSVGELNFSKALSSHMVLQQQPEQAAVYGYLGNASCNGKTSGCISVTLKDGKGTVVKTVDATITLTNATTKAYRWKALLPPTAAGGPYSITAACAAGAPCNDTVTIDDIMFGEVWFCAGQSNMWLTNWYTFSRNASLASVRAGNYNNIRVAAGDSQCPPNDQGGPHCTNLEPASGNAAVFPWYPAQDAATINISAFNYLPPFAKDREAYLFDVLSATCWSFAEALTDQLKASGKTPPPIGIVNVAIGGSQIEEWMPVSVSQQCAGAALQSKVPQQLWETIVRDNYLDMTVKGWLWYQGENNAGSLHGNFGTQSGYGCTMPALIKYWREQWSATPGTTAATAPFGLVSLSPDDSEGSPDMGSFRWAQSGGFGVVPNSAMPNVFMAHAYDLADPYESGSHCSSSGDIYCQCNTPGLYSTDYGCYTPNWMGPLVHPRLKKPIGQRLAASAINSVYGGTHAVTGPTIAGCTLAAGPAGTNASTLMVAFDTALLRDSKLVVKSYDLTKPNQSAFLALANISTTAEAWVPLNIKLNAAGTGITIDLAPLNGATPLAIRYAWGGVDAPDGGDDVKCCIKDVTNPSDSSKPYICNPAQCPILAAVPNAPFGGLPANPFLAKIVAGKCECPTPQVCSA